MTYSRTLDNIWTAIWYGRCNSRYDRYISEGTLIRILKVFHHPNSIEEVELARFDLLTGKFECLTWPESRGMKITIGEFFVELNAIFEVTEAVGPPGFHNRWDKRIKKMQKMRKIQETVQAAESDIG